jgi:hypothetical protein
LCGSEQRLGISGADDDDSELIGVRRPRSSPDMMGEADHDDGDEVWEDDGESAADDDEQSLGVADGELVVDPDAELRSLLDPGETIVTKLDCYRVHVSAALRAPCRSPLLCITVSRRVHVRS